MTSTPTDPILPTPSSRLDHWGIAASSLCAVHCAAMAVVGLAPALGVFGSERGEWAFVAIAFGLGLLSLVPSYRTHHRDLRPLGLFSLGVSTILAARILSTEGSPLETVGAVVGALMLVTSHGLNLRLIRRRPNCCAADCAGQ
jgi:hypothetical protein